jgi:hypothetical protein
MSIATREYGEYVPMFTCASAVFIAKGQNQMPNDQIGPKDTIWSGKILRFQ